MAQLSSVVNKKYHILYKTTNLINGKYYIGIHSTNDLNDGYIGSGYLLWSEIEKFGEHNFKCERLRMFKLRKLLIRAERLWVTPSFIKRPDTYNLATGRGSLLYYKGHSEQTKILISKKSKAMWANPDKRLKIKNSIKRTMTPESIKIRSNSAKLAWSSHIDREQHSKSTKEALSKIKAKLSKSKKEMWINPDKRNIILTKRNTAENKSKISKAMKHINRKPWLVHNVKNNIKFLKPYFNLESIYDLYKLNLNYNDLVDMCFRAGYLNSNRIPDGLWNYLNKDLNPYTDPDYIEFKTTDLYLKSKADSFYELALGSNQTHSDLLSKLNKDAK